MPRSANWTCPLDTCLKPFNRKSDLTRHVYTHLDHKPHLCKWEGCGASFAQKGALKVHTNTHTGNRPYKCTIGECNRTFRDPASASRHKKKCDGEWCSPDSVRGRGKALLRTNEETVVQTLVDPLHHPQYAPLGGSKFYLPQHAFAIHQNQYLTQPPLQTAPPKSQTVALSTDQALDLERMCNRLGLANLRGPQRETATEIPTPPLTASSTDSSPSPSLSDLPPEQLTWIRATQPPFQYQQQHQQSQFGTSNESTRYPFVSSAFSTSPFHSQYMGSTFLPVIQ